MAQRLNYRRQCTDAPCIISTLDPSVAVFLAALPAVTVHSHSAGSEWAFPITETDSDQGSAYIVSAAVLRRVVSGRLS
jgi:hypothetical protein